jgi:UDP-2,3-diacylglucosamine pyrophosphatase LpxH
LSLSRVVLTLGLDPECSHSLFPDAIRRQFSQLKSDFHLANRLTNPWRRDVIARRGCPTRTWARVGRTRAHCSISCAKYDFETLYIVGDLIDIWALRRGRYWPQQHNDVIQKILRKSRKGTRVVYIPGNHDELLTKFYGAYGNIVVQKHAIHRLGDGRRMLVIHGHELDAVVQNVKWLAFAGDVGYQFLLGLNPGINFVRRRFGLGYWSLSAYAKKRVKDAVSFIGRYEEEIVHYAQRFSVDAVLCGHIHSAAIRQFGAISYYNCGDWVESCSALVEGSDGQISMVSYLPRVQRVQTRSPQRELIGSR